LGEPISIILRMIKEADPQHGAGGAVGGVVHPDELVAGELGAEAAVLDAVLGGIIDSFCFLRAEREGGSDSVIEESPSYQR
jgi:hypothetical protein